MRKHWVFELSTESHNLFRNLAEQQEFTEVDIQNGLDSKVDDLQETAEYLAFKICGNPKCKEFFNEGYITDYEKPFCSTECAEIILDDEDDYLNDIVAYFEFIN